MKENHHRLFYNNLTQANNQISVQNDNLIHQFLRDQYNWGLFFRNHHNKQNIFQFHLLLLESGKQYCMNLCDFHLNNSDYKFGNQFQ